MLQGYIKLAQAELQRMLDDPLAVFVFELELPIRIYFLSVFWTAVYGGRSVVEGVTLPAMLTYATLGVLQRIVLRTNVNWEVQSRVRTGAIIVDLLRPYGFLRAQFATDIGQLVWHGGVALVVILVATFIVPVQGPASAMAGVCYVLSLVLSFGVHFLLKSLLGLAAFWSLEITSLNTTLDVLMNFLAGIFVPLWLLPLPLQRLSMFLPFQSLVYLPVSIYIGKLTGDAIWSAIGQQLAWIAILLVIVTLVQRVTVRRLVVQGG